MSNPFSQAALNELRRMTAPSDSNSLPENLSHAEAMIELYSSVSFPEGTPEEKFRCGALESARESIERTRLSHASLMEHKRMLREIGEGIVIAYGLHTAVSPSASGSAPACAQAHQPASASSTSGPLRSESDQSPRDSFAPNLPESWKDRTEWLKVENSLTYQDARIKILSTLNELMACMINAAGLLGEIQKEVGSGKVKGGAA